MEDRRVKSQRRIDDSPCFPAFTGVGEIAGEPRVSALPSEIEAVQAFSYEDRTVIAAGAAKPIPKT
jgi:hypothetical protein